MCGIGSLRIKDDLCPPTRTDAAERFYLSGQLHMAAPLSGIPHRMAGHQQAEQSWRPSEQHLLQLLLVVVSIVIVPLMYISLQGIECLTTPISVSFIATSS